MGIRRQRDSDAGKISDSISDWFRQFVKHLELHMVDAGQGLPPDAGSEDCSVAAMRAVQHTLRDAGLHDEQIVNLFARVAFEKVNAAEPLQWNAALNKRRFQLIDGDIQGILSATEQLELAALTQLMREHVDSEANLPLDGAKKLHRRLARLDSESTDSEQ